MKTNLIIRFKNGNIKQKASSKAYEEFLKEIKDFKYAKRIATNWYVNAREFGNTHVNDYGEKYKLKDISNLKIVAMIEGFAYELSGNVLKLYCKHISGDFEYVSAYRLYKEMVLEW